LIRIKKEVNKKMKDGPEGLCHTKSNLIELAKKDAGYGLLEYGIFVIPKPLQYAVAY
jgi:hypothetical protein